MKSTTCELCSTAGGRPIFDNGRARVVVVDEPDYPGFIRVIWNAHIKELTDLSAEERAEFMHVVFAVEEASAVLAPDKMNVASLGNMTPPLHWHLIPRFADDAHFPGPIWSERRRSVSAETLAAPGAAGAAQQAIAARLHRAINGTRSPCGGRQPPLHGRTDCAGNSRIEASRCAAAASSSRTGSAWR
jgi:diadenosine tetraphosphate (Ap4A) HIT family hydrolase